MPDSVPFEHQNRPASDRNAVRHVTGILSAMPPECCPSWSGTRNHSAFRKVYDAVPARRGMLRYFSFATLTTLGDGDIQPVSPIARSLAILEALFGQLYPAVMIARLISLEIVGRRRPAGVA